MNEQLGQRCTLAMLFAMTLALAVGLLAWGPVPLLPEMHHYADERTLLGLPHAMNVLANVPLFAAGAWGWRAFARCPWPAAVRLPWKLFFACAMLAALLATGYHVAPGAVGYLLAQIVAAGGFVMLLCGFLAERVDARFGSARSCVTALALVAGAGVLIGLLWSRSGVIDLRPLMLLQVLPVLLIPAGALGLAGQHTRAGDWFLMLGLYALCKLCELGDETVLAATGAVSGHTLMHLGLALITAWLAYRVAASATVVAAAAPSPSAESRASTA